MRCSAALAFGFLLMLVGCGPGIPPLTKLDTDPPGATLAANGQPIGTSPATYRFVFDNSTSSYTLIASEVGYLDSKTVVLPNSPDYQSGDIKVTLQPDQLYVNTVTSEATNHPVRVQVNPQLTQDFLWTHLVDLTTSRYTGLEQLDPGSGYIRSEPAVRVFPNPLRGSTTIRTQFLGNIASRDPLVYKINIKSEVSYGDAPNQWIEYGRVLKEDYDLVGKIRQLIEIAH